MSGTARPDMFRVTVAMAFPAFLAEGRGRCADDPFPDDFTEDGDRPYQQKMRHRAVSVCRGCPFRVPCREWAIETSQQGVYGATTTRQRELYRATRDQQRELSR